MLQEASGAAGHPSYRRYHDGEGPLLVEDGGTRRFISTDCMQGGHGGYPHLDDAP